MLNNRKILTGCFAVSLFLHLVAVAFLQRYSVWFSSPKTTNEPSEWLSLVDKKERDQILKVAFEKIPSEETKIENSPQPQKETLAHLSLHVSPRLPNPENELPFQSPMPLTTHDFLSSLSTTTTFSIPEQSFNLLDHLPKDLIVPAPSHSPARISPLPVRSAVALSTALPKLQDHPPEMRTTFAETIELALPEIPIAAKAPSMIPMPNLPSIPTLAELETASYSDSFDADLVFLPKEEGQGFIFALTLIPKPDLELSRIRQHFTFLIDRANSIQQGRLAATKAAVHKALEELSPEDTFNIIAFDSKMEKMSPNWLPCTEKSFALAEEFLEKIQLGSFFASSDLYKPLLIAVPGQVQNDELHTAILLTDGEPLVKKPIQRALLHDWTRYNNGRVALYAIGLSGDNHLATLDTATIFNKGKLSNASTPRGIKRKLLKLMKTIQNPIAKNIACKAISRSPQAKVHLFPQTSQMPHLYIDQPYVILGETDTLDDFILFVQGRLKNRWLNIKKTITFLNAKRGSKSLKQEWALQCAYKLYEQYVADENPKHIAEAEAILEPYDYQVAFR